MKNNKPKTIEWVCSHGVTFNVGGNIPESGNCEDYHKPLPRADTSDEDKVAMMKLGRALSNPPVKTKGIADKFFIDQYDESMRRRGNDYELSLEEFRWHERNYRKWKGGN